MRISTKMIYDAGSSQLNNLTTHQMKLMDQFRV